MSKKRRVEESNLDDAQETQKAKQKRLRTVTDEKRELATIFDELSNDDESARLDAALNLVQICKNNNGSGREPSFESARPIYGRLMRGLCSSRKSARHGFFIALVEILRLFKNSSDLRNSCLELVKVNTQLHDVVNGQERRNHLIGRMSGYTAIIHSKIFFHGGLNQMTRFTTLLNDMIDSYLESPWLHEQLGSILCQTIVVLHTDLAPSEWTSAILTTLVDRGLARTPLGIAIWLEVQRTAPGLKLPKHVWQHQDPMSGHSFPDVIKIMKGSSKDADGSLQPQRRVSTGARQSQPSFAWHVILSILSQPAQAGGGVDSKSQKRFLNFWTEAVDRNFFAPSASHEKRYLGFQILVAQLQSAAPWQIEPMLSQQLVLCLINQSSQSDRYLHSVSESTLETLVIKVETDLKSAVPLLACLMCKSELAHFDKRSKSNVVERILRRSLSDIDARPRVLSLLGTTLDRCQSANDPEAVKLQQSIMETTSAAVRDVAAQLDENSPKHTQCLRQCLAFLYERAEAQHDQRRDSSDAGANASKPGAEKAVEAILATLAGKSSDSAHSIIVNQMVNMVEKQSAASTLRQSLQPVAKWLLRKKSWRSSANAKEASRSAFQLLFSLVLWVCIVGDEEALPIFEELKGLYEKDQGRLTQEDADVVVDLILSLIPQQNLLYRRLAMSAFRQIGDLIGAEGLQSLTDVLGKKENIAGKNDLEQEMSEEEGGAGEASSEDDSKSDVKDDQPNIEMDSDVEVDEAEDASAASSEAGGDDSSDAGSDASELNRFNEKLASTLGTNQDAKGDESGSSDESMDDEQMLALEPQLAEMFRQRLGEGASEANDRKSAKSGGGEKKQEQAAARRDILEFKNRVLDMLEQYLTHNPSNALNLEAAVPLLRLVRTTRSKQLREKAARILKAWQTLAKKKGEPAFQAKSANGGATGETQHDGWAVLGDVHAEVLERPFSHLHAGLCSSTSIFLCRCAIREGQIKHNSEKVVSKRLKKMERVYSSTREKAEAGRQTQLLASGFWRDFESWQKDVAKTVA